MKLKRTWILIADGAHGRILYTEGWESGLTIVSAHDSDAATKRTRELGTDRPGRVQDSAGPARHAMEPRVDWQRHEKHLFAKEMAKTLNKGAHNNAYDRLVLVAPPAILGELRAALDKTARELVSAELDKDLTQVPLHDLPKRLRKITPV